MKKENCTKGPVRYHLGRGANPRFHIQTEAGYQIASTTELSHHAQAKEENAMREANAELIAETFNVLHETGYTPAEIAEQVKELCAALERMTEATEGIDNICDGDDDKLDEWKKELRAVDKALVKSRAILSRYQPVTPAF